jgi:hypothetical protein
VADDLTVQFRVQLRTQRLERSNAILLVPQLAGYVDMGVNSAVPTVQAKADPLGYDELHHLALHLTGHHDLLDTLAERLSGLNDEYAQRMHSARDHAEEHFFDVADRSRTIRHAAENHQRG